MYRIEYADGVVINIHKLSGRGMLRWGWTSLTGEFVEATHLDVARAEATDTGGKFVAVRKPRTATARPVGLATILRSR